MKKKTEYKLRNVQTKDYLQLTPTPDQINPTKSYISILRVNSNSFHAVLKLTVYNKTCNKVIIHIMSKTVLTK